MKKHIIVTGASRGIGYQLVKQFAAAGHKVLAISRNEARLQQLQSEAGGEVSILPFDLTSGEDFDALLNKVEDLGGVIDVLVHNAGALLNKPFEEITAEEQHYIYKVNVFGVMDLTKALLPALKKSEGAHVVNISSMGGFQGASKFPGLSVYSSSKAALVGLTECLAEEYKEERVKFNCLCLGAVQTEMLEEAFPGYEAPVSADQMASYINDFALSASGFLNGKIIPVSLSTP